MEQCQSLTALTLERKALDENRIRMLGDFSSPYLEIELQHCPIIGSAAAVLDQVLKCNQGPTKLAHCGIDTFVLADGLRGNHRLKSLTSFISDNPGLGNQNLLAFASALRETKVLLI
jgi:hypothetical protein